MNKRLTVFVVVLLVGCTANFTVQVPSTLEKLQQVVPAPKRVEPPKVQEPERKKSKKPVYAPFCRNGEWKNSAEYRYTWCRI